MVLLPGRLTQIGAQDGKASEKQDTVADGFHYTSPVGHYGKTPLGLSDMTGNVWEWCKDYFMA